MRLFLARAVVAAALLLSLRADGWNFKGPGDGGGFFASTPRTASAAVRVVTLSYAAQTSSTTDLTEYTYSGVALGTAAGNRRVVVGASGSTGTATVASMTIGGVAAAAVVALAPVGTLTAELWSAAVPTGATGNIVVTWSAGQLRSGIGVWAVYGGAATPHHTGSGSGDDPACALNIAKNGAAIGYAANDNGTYNWTGLTENFDAAFEGAVEHSGASDTFTAAETGRAITAGIISFGTNSALVCASWAPS